MNREEYLQEISNTLIEVTLMFHQEDADIVTELHNNTLNVSQQVGEEMRKIKEAEKIHEST